MNNLRTTQEAITAAASLLSRFSRYPSLDEQDRIQCRQVLGLLEKAEQWIYPAAPGLLVSLEEFVINLIVRHARHGATEEEVNMLKRGEAAIANARNESRY